MSPALPIDAHLPAIVASLRKHPVLLLQASPGSGKTTRVPGALLGLTGERGQVWVLEPRRLAAKWAALRVASEMGEEIGGRVGYQFRFEKREGPRTRLKFITEGMLLRKLAADPLLKDVECVVLDEFHERHLATDLALTCLLELRKRRPGLGLVIMSATLDIEGLLPLLGPGTPTIQVEAPRHPVDIRHLSEPPAKRIEDLVAQHARRLLDETTGDLLVFLPGMAEIRRTEQALQNVPAHTFILHGDLAREEQDRIMAPGQQRRIILSTNLAESSVTIPGITGVIDSGLQRIASHSPWSGVPALRTRPVSKASATQRAGRAGRTGPGICQRLFTRGDLEGRPAFEVPEIKRADLAQVILELRGIGVAGSIRGMSWLDFPELASWEAGARLLHLLGFLEEPSLESGLSEAGRIAAGLSMHPRISRLLLESARIGKLDEHLPLAVLLSEGELADHSRLPDRGIPDSVVTGMQRRALEHFREQIPRHGLGPAASVSGPLTHCLLRAYPDRVVRVTPPAPTAVSAASGALELHPQLAELLALQKNPVTAIALEVQERQSRQLGAGGSGKSTPVIEAWLPIDEGMLLDLEPSLITEAERPLFDEKQKRVRWSSELSYGGIVLSQEHRDPRIPEEWKQAESILLRQAWNTEIPEGRVSLASAHEFIATLRNQGQGEVSDFLETLFSRLILIHEHKLLADGLPAYRDLLAGAIEGRLSLKELEAVDWEAATTGALLELCPGIRLKDWTPTSITLPGPPQGARPGPRQARIHYRLGHAPWVESRLQDFWGLKETPKILAGRLRLTLHLLAPNQRAVQVTQDLPGFWERAYPEIKKELSRNYPRHFWP